MGFQTSRIANEHILLGFGVNHTVRDEGRWNSSRPSMFPTTYTSSLAVTHSFMLTWLRGISATDQSCAKVNYAILGASETCGPLSVQIYTYGYKSKSYLLLRSCCALWRATWGQIGTCTELSIGLPTFTHFSSNHFVQILYLFVHPHFLEYSVIYIL